MNRNVFMIAGVFTLTISTGAFTAGNADSGKAVFQGRCGECHYVDKNRGIPLGPNLDGFFSRKAASEEGYDYSAALKNANLTWDEATLDKWLADPAAMVPGTRMLGFRGLKDETTRADVIAYLATLK